MKISMRSCQKLLIQALVKIVLINSRRAMDCSAVTELEQTYCKLISFCHPQKQGENVNLHPDPGFCYRLKILQLEVFAISKLRENVLFEFLVLDKFHLFIFYIYSSNKDCI